MRKAREFARARGGIACARTFTRIWLALFGQYPWDELPAMPPELMLLPKKAPLNIYRFSSWARGTIVPLLVLMDARPARSVPEAARLDDLMVPAAQPARARDFADRAFLALDRALHLYDRLPVHPLRARALDEAERWILAHQEADGSWGGIQPPWVYSLMALHARGHSLDSPAVEKGLRGMHERWMIRRADGTVRVQACLSPVWDTGLALLALCERAVSWMLAMQSANGGFAAFDKDNTSRLSALIPFADFGEMIDPPSVDVTAHVLETLGAFGFGRRDGRVRRALEYLYRGQEKEGSWFGRWGVNHLYGTGAVLPALAAVGEPLDGLAARRAVRWLEQRQNADGGFGETCASYVDRAMRGRGESTPSQTAWALLALVAAGRTDSVAARRAARFLAERQRTDGAWDEEQFTGCGFPGYGIGE